MMRPAKCRLGQGSISLDLLMGTFVLAVGAVGFYSLQPTLSRADQIAREEATANQMVNRMVEQLQLLKPRDLNVGTLHSLGLINAGQSSQPYNFSDIPLDEASRYSPSEALRNGTGSLETWTQGNGTALVRVRINWTSASGRQRSVSTGLVLGSFPMKRRGISLIELLFAMVLLAGLTMATMGMLLSGLNTLNRVDGSARATQPTYQAMRRISDTIRAATAVSITDSGRRLNFTLPQLNAAVDPVTGERELRFPLVSDGVARWFVVANNRLVLQPDNLVLMENIRATDPLSTSTQFNQTYTPFQLTTIGSRRAVTITLIAEERLDRGKTRFARFRSTVLIQNSR